MIGNRARSLFKTALLVSIFLFFGINSAVAQSETSIAVDSVYGTDGSLTLVLSSYSANLDAVSINWLVGGKSVQSGIGKKSFLIPILSQAPSSLIVKISLPEGEVQKTINLKPNESMLLWEATDSYVPPFYKGKALPSPGSSIKVVAVPQIRSGGTILDNKSLIYNWEKNYENESSSSGYGKNYFKYVNDFFEPSETVGLTASTASGALSTNGSINIAVYSPEIFFYRKDPQLGTAWNKSVDNGSFVANGEVFTAAPYFISPKDIRRPDLVFSWFINDNPLNLPNYAKNSLPLAIQEGVTGSSILRLEIENTNKIFQEVMQEIELTF